MLQLCLNIKKRKALSERVFYLGILTFLASFLCWFFQQNHRIKYFHSPLKFSANAVRDSTQSPLR